MESSIVVRQDMPQQCTKIRIKLYSKVKKNEASKEIIYSKRKGSKRMLNGNQDDGYF